MDLPSARNAAELTDLFGFHEIKHHEWHIQSCCAITGEGLDEGLDWLTSKLCASGKGKGEAGMKHITKLPDHEKKAKLTDFSMTEKDEGLGNVSG